MRHWYTINSQANGPVEVDIFDEIGGWGVYAADFKREFESAVSTGRDIVLNVNSPGGDVFEGMAIYNTIAKYRSKTTAVITGVAASIASVLILAAGTRKSGEGSFFMIHNPWTWCAGDAEFLRKRAATLDQIREQMVGIYEKNSSLTRDEIVQAMDDETWYSPDDAFQAGFVQSIDDSSEIAAAAFDWKSYHYKKVPQPLAKHVHAKAPQTQRELEESLLALGYTKKQAVNIVNNGFQALLGDPASDGQQRDSVDPAQYIRGLQLFKPKHQ